MGPPDLCARHSRSMQRHECNPLPFSPPCPHTQARSHFSPHTFYYTHTTPHPSTHALTPPQNLGTATGLAGSSISQWACQSHRPPATWPTAHCPPCLLQYALQLACQSFSNNPQQMSCKCTPARACCPSLAVGALQPHPLRQQGNKSQTDARHLLSSSLRNSTHGWPVMDISARTRTKSGWFSMPIAASHGGASL